MRTGSLARPVEDYPDIVAYNLMFCAEEMIRIQDKILEKHSDSEWERVRTTGDDLADQWEKQLARGELPGWMKG